MPQHRSAIKRVKQNEKARKRNSHYKTTLKTAIKKLKTAPNKEEAQQRLREVVSLADRLVSKGIIHKNRASAYKSKLTHLVNSM